MLRKALRQGFNRRRIDEVWSRGGNIPLAALRPNGGLEPLFKGVFQNTGKRQARNKNNEKRQQEIDNQGAGRIEEGRNKPSDVFATHRAFG